MLVILVVYTSDMYNDRYSLEISKRGMKPGNAKKPKAVPGRRPGVDSQKRGLGNYGGMECGIRNRIG